MDDKTEYRLRVARATDDEVTKVWDFVREVNDLYYYEDGDIEDMGNIVESRWDEMSPSLERIFMGYMTLVDNVCDKSKSYLAAKSEWIGVEERLPENYKDGGASLNVLVCIQKKRPRPGEGPRIAIGYYRHFSEEWRWGTGAYELESWEEVTHWMPLPELPTEVGNAGHQDR